MVLRTTDPTSPHLSSSALGSVTPKPFSDRAILHAARHHQRALAALRKGNLDGLSTPMSDRLIERLARDLERLEAELDRRAESLDTGDEG